MSTAPETEGNFRRGRKHHFQVHDLPRISQKAALKLLGAETITAAVEELKNKRPAELRAVFEKVYKSPTRSQNKRWLQRRLAEALRIKPSVYFPLSNKTRQTPTSEQAPTSNASVSVEISDTPKKANIHFLRSSAKPAAGTSAAATPRVADVHVKKEDNTSENTRSEEDFMLESASDHSDSHTGSLQSPESEPLQEENEMLGCDQLLPWPSTSSADFLATIMDNKPITGTFIGAVAPAPVLPAAPPLLTGSPSMLACMRQGQVLYHQHQHAAAMVQINHVMMKLKAVQEERLVKLLAEREEFETKPSLSFLETDFFNLSDLQESGCNPRDGPSLNESGELTPVASHHSHDDTLPLDEGDDEPFLTIDPVLVDMDMQLLPDGSMW